MPFLSPPPEDEKFLRRVFQLVVLALIIIVVVLTQELLLLAFGSLLIALLLSAVAEFLQRHFPVARGPALAIATAALLGVLGLVGWLFYSELATQAEALARDIPRAWERLQASWREGAIGALLLDSLQSRGTVTWITNEARAIIAGTALVLFNFLIVLAAAVFFAANPKRYREGLTLLAPHRYRQITRETLIEIGTALRLWLVAQSISMLVLGGLITLGLWWSGVPAYGALGILGGLAEFIPYVGPILAMVPALLLAFAGQGSLAGVIATYLVVRLVQVNIVTPLVTGRVVSVAPGFYIFFILAAGYIFGTFGLFFSGPLAIAIYAGWLKLYSRETLGDTVELPSEQTDGHSEAEEVKRLNAASPPKRDRS